VRERERDEEKMMIVIDEGKKKEKIIHMTNKRQLVMREREQHDIKVLEG